MFPGCRVSWRAGKAEHCRSEGSAVQARRQRLLCKSIFSNTLLFPCMPVCSVLVVAYTHMLANNFLESILNMPITWRGNCWAARKFRMIGFLHCTSINCFEICYKLGTKMKIEQKNTPVDEDLSINFMML